MPVTLEQNDAVNLIRLEGAVDISSAGELKQLQLLALETGGEMHVAVDRLTSLDVTAIELLWAAEREASKNDIGFSFDGSPPAEVVSALGEAGLEMILSFPEAIQSAGGER